MILAMVWAIFNLLLLAVLTAAGVYLFVLLVRALKKYIGSREVRAEKQAAKRTLGGDTEGLPYPLPDDAGV